MISILIPAYNVAAYLEECLDSVLRCAGSREIEVVVCVDARSTDATASIVQDYAARYPQVRAVLEELHGIGYLRNRGLELARGSLLMFVDADDVVPPGAIEAMCRAMTDDVDVVFGRLVTSRKPVTKTVKYLNGEDAAEAMLYQRRLHEGVHCSVWGKLWRTSLWRGVRFPENILYEDLATVPLVAARCRKVALTPHPVYYYRRRTGSILHHFSSQRFTSVEAAGLLLRNPPATSFARAAHNRQLSAAFNIMRLMWRHRSAMTRDLWDQGRRVAVPVIRAYRSETLTNIRSRCSVRIASLLSYLFC